jgi:hypothetical protein
MLQEDDKMKIGYRKKWKDDAVSPVIATILMVAITPDENVNANFDTPDMMPDEKYRIMVTATNPEKNLEQFTVRLYEDGQQVGYLNPLEDNASNGKILSFTDRDGGGTLSIGDVFVVQTELDRMYELVLFFGTHQSAKSEWSA